MEYTSVMQAIGKVWRSVRRAWGQVRWQVAACYVLPGVVSVLLVAAFGSLVLNMLVRRAAVNLVERQVYLQVELAAHSVDSLASILAGEAQGCLESQWVGRLSSLTANTPARLGGIRMVPGGRRNGRHLLPP